MTNDREGPSRNGAGRTSTPDVTGADQIGGPDRAGLNEAAADAATLDAIRRAVLQEGPARLRRRGRRPAGVMPSNGGPAGPQPPVAAPEHTQTEPVQREPFPREPVPDGSRDDGRDPPARQSLETPVAPVTPTDHQPSDEADDAECPSGDGHASGPRSGPDDLLRIAEALLFASSEPLSDREIASRLPEGCAVDAVMADLARLYEGRGVNVVAVAGGWAFRTAGDLGYLLEKERVEPKKLSRAAMETLAIIAYHQPITRAEIEELRGVSVSKGTLDVLLDVGWARMRGRKPVPGRPITYGTTEAFLDHFGLASIMDLPGLEELKSAGLLDWRLPPDFAVPSPSQEGTVPGDGDLSEDDLSETLSEE